MKCPDLHIKFMVGNTTPMEQGKGVEGYIIKKIHDGNSTACPELHKTHFSYSPTSTKGLSPIQLKHLTGNCMKCPELQRNLMFGNLHPIGEGNGHITRNNF